MGQFTHKSEVLCNYAAVNITIVFHVLSIS